MIHPRARRVFAAFIAGWVLAGPAAAVIPDPGFSDVPPTHAFYDDIAWMAAKGVAGGYPDGTYRPTLDVSRQAMAAFFHRLAVPTPPPGGWPDPGFTDVPTSHAYHDEIAWMASAGIAGGYPDGTFRPTVAVSRQAMAAFFHRFAYQPTAPPGGWPDPGFTDVPSSHAYYDEIAWMASAGIAGGYPDGTFRPTVAVSRQAMAAFFHRLATGSGTTTRVSVSEDGASGGGGEPAISGDGRSVAFIATEPLVTEDENETQDIFVRDLDAGTIERISVATDGTEADDWSSRPALSSDGRYVSFFSFATNLVAGDTNGDADVFVHDRMTGETARVSVNSDGAQAFDGPSFDSSISADGQIVAFLSLADDLVADDTNDARDIFVHDRAAGTTVRASIDSAGGQLASDSYLGALSSDGSTVGFATVSPTAVAGDTNGVSDAFVHRLDTATTTRISVGTAGIQGTGPAFTAMPSADGSVVVFSSFAENLVAGDDNWGSDVFVRDLDAGTTVRVSVASTGALATAGSSAPTISANGRVVAFSSSGAGLVADDANGLTDTFVHDVSTGETALMSVDSAGVPADDESFSVAISGDGRHVVFRTNASNLFAGDDDISSDVFVHDRYGG